MESADKKKEGEPKPANKPVVSWRTVHPVTAAIDKLVDRLRDTRFTARVFLPLVAKNRREEMKRTAETLRRSATTLESSDSDAASVANAVREANQAMRFTRRVMQSHPAELMARGLFLSIFSSFDAFMGELLTALYSLRPELYKSLGGSVELKEVLDAPNIDALKASILQKEIETLRRGSYTEQFDALEGRFGLPMRQWPNWKHFVEASQRRNLITHCDGLVSQQYLQQCMAAGFTRGELPDLNSEIKLPATYFMNACELLIEAGSKLAHTLWRKLIPDELATSDRHLNELAYESLCAEQWHRARMLCEFALNQKKHGSEHGRLSLVVNYAQAIKWSGLETDMRRVLDQEDWTAVAPAFALAHAVLTERYSDAANVMRYLGERSAFPESNYLEWPLFRAFRETAEFEAAYLEIFGHSFAKQAQQNAGVAVAEAAREDPQGAPALPTAAASFGVE